MASAAGGKVDVHHHIVPDFYRDAVLQTGGDPSGSVVAPWSEAEALVALDTLGIAKAYASVT